MTGGFDADALSGTAGNDGINGGPGADTMLGGAGDDTYLVDNNSDRVVENASQGIDTVVSFAASHSLAANVENLILAGGGAQIGMGNALNNLMIAGSGQDRMDGGAGNDILTAGIGGSILTGGSGNDIFVVEKLGALNRITDFRVGEDLLDLRALMASYAGADPIGDGAIAIRAAQGGGLALYADPAGSGTLRAVAELQGVAPQDLRVGTDLLWDQISPSSGDFSV